MDNDIPTVPPERTSAKAGVGSGVQEKIIERVAETQIEAIRRAPLEQTGILQIAWIMCLLVAGLGGYILYLGNTVFGFGAIVVGVIGFIVAMFFLRPRSIAASPDVIPSAPRPPAAQWSRITTKLPIPVNKLTNLSARLQQIRTLAQAKYSDLLKARGFSTDKIDLNRVRVNVFLPDTQDAIYGEVCGLFIPRSLHLGMTNEDERRVRFRPNEGLTGRVFTLQKAYGALRDSSDSEWQQIFLEGVGGKGDEKFQLTLEQIHLIDRDLRWIVSFPLKLTPDDVNQTFGVLNVDGFTEALRPDEMQSLYHHLKEAVDQYAHEVSKLDKCRITITLEDVEVAPAS